MAGIGWAAALTRAEASGFRVGGSDEVLYVGLERKAGWTRGAAEDAGGPDGVDERAVLGAIAGCDSLPEAGHCCNRCCGHGLTVPGEAGFGLSGSCAAIPKPAA